MRFTALFAAALAILVTGCIPPDYVPPTAVSQTVQAAVATAQATMRTPNATPTGTPSATPTWTPVVVPTFPLAPTATATPIPNRTPAQTPPPAQTPTGNPSTAALTITFLSCDLGFDITHGMGEVENAYVRVRNTGGIELTNVLVTLQASKEGRPHPDKSRSFASLPAKYEVTTKLTVDTQSGSLTVLEASATTSQGGISQVSGADCRALNKAELDKLTPILNKPTQIQEP